jgi:hypothetical protein
LIQSIEKLEKNNLNNNAQLSGRCLFLTKRII